MCDGRVVVCLRDYAEEELGWEMIVSLREGEGGWLFRGHF